MSVSTAGRARRPGWSAMREGWSTAGITALGELLSPSRLTGTAARMSVQLFLVVCLWHALYSDTETSGGLDEGQAVAYGVLAVLALRLRDTDRWIGRDMVIQQIEFGTIVYWFLRPLAPWRYYLRRAVGDQLYGFAWAAAGYVVCLLAGVMDPPASAGAAGAFAVTFLLGQSVLYYLVLLTDQMCFWAVRNDSAVEILQFAQNLLSGGYAALWYFPGWFQTMSALLPFQATLSVPLSFYVGRLPVDDLPRHLAVQLFWVVSLAALTRLVWRRAEHRVVSQGG
ncbi:MULTISPECIES: ABC-2 family transporter protein [Actinomadura]|nr:MULTISPECIES: ABC-2 family transporter protein [Actinomadura]MBT2210911.1 ABC-2 family transporter protein [Actinomadura sp. NEAU-AAG7]